MVGHHAEEPAWREAGVIGQQFEVAAGGKSEAQFPGIDGGDRHAQALRYLLEGHVMLQAPGLKRRRKTRANVATKIGLERHGVALRLGGEERKPKPGSLRGLLLKMGDAAVKQVPGGGRERRTHGNRSQVSELAFLPALASKFFVASHD